MMHSQNDLADPACPVRLGVSMFFISFATVLFTLSVWKLLSFFIMPSLFFDLLFVGFPVGAFLGVKFFRVSLRAFERTLWILQGAMLLSIIAALLAKHFDYLRAHLFEVVLVKLMGQMGTFTLLFIPFFCAYGLSEYVGYQLGTTHLKGRMRLVYAIYLFGAAFAYLFLQLALAKLGVSGVIVLSVLLVSLASLTLSTRGSARLFFAVESALLLALLFVPGLEGRFLLLYKGAGFQSTRFYSQSAQGGYEHRFQEWGRYGLTEIMHSRRDGQFLGFYNDIMQWEYEPRVGFRERMLGAVPINIVPAGGRIAIIGAGGGRQVKWALQPRFSFQNILGIELEPAVIEAVRGPLREAFDSVYERPSVRPVISEARSYMEKSEETFDLIFLPSVGGYPQMMLEPGNMIRTIDAYRTLKDRLTDRGILAIWYPSGLDKNSILTSQYVRTLGAPGLQMKTMAYANFWEYLILATKDPTTPLPTLEEINAFLTGPADPSGLPPDTTADAEAHYFYVADDPRFKPITDDQPFLAGNVSYIFSLGQVYVLFVTVVSFLVVAGVSILLALRNSGDPKIPGRSYWQVSSLSLLIGANFILMEHYVVLALFKKLYVFQDALALGAISFLVLTGLGSVLIGRRTRGLFQALAMVSVLPIVFFQESLSPSVAVALLAPLAFATGSFFPGLFEMAFRNPLCVFAMDAIGAAAGSCVSFFIPIAFGFSVFFPVGVLVFLLTSFFSWRFYRTPGAGVSL